MEQKKMALSNAIILTAVLSVLVVVLQIIGVLTIDLEELAIALALIPICLGAFYGGPYVGAILGAVFAITVLFTPSTWTFLKIDPFATVLTVFVKGVLAGYLPGLLFILLTRVNKVFASIIGATVCTLVNTLVFLIGSLVFMTDNLAELTNGTRTGLIGGLYWFWSIIADNFIFEFAFAIMIAPLIYLTFESIRYYKRKKYIDSKRHHHHRRPHHTGSSSHHTSNH